jgi:neurotransmitter:Na+ symporter, NSS family
VLAGLSSLISVVQTFVAGVQEKFGLARRNAVLIGGGVAAVVSLLYATDGGLYILDSADFFINQFGIAVVGLVEVILVAWILRRLGLFQRHANGISDIPLGLWWKVALAVITPVLLGWVVLDSLLGVIRDGYEDYPTGFLLATGWSVAIGAVVVAVGFSFLRWPRGVKPQGVDDADDVRAAQEVET